MIGQRFAPFKLGSSLLCIRPVADQDFIRIDMGSSLPVIIQRDNLYSSFDGIEIYQYSTMLCPDSCGRRISGSPFRRSIKLRTYIIKILITLIAVHNIRDAFQIIPLADNITEAHLLRFQNFFRFPEHLLRLFTDRKSQIVGIESSRYYFPIMTGSNPKVADGRSHLFFYRHFLTGSCRQRMDFHDQFSHQRLLGYERKDRTGRNEMIVHPLFQKRPLELIFPIILTECKEYKTDHFSPMFLFFPANG